MVSWTPHFVAALLFLALIGTAVTYLIWFTELQHAPLGSLSAWTMLTPVFGITLGWLVLGDRLSVQQAIGVSLVLTALPVILLPGRHSRDMAGMPGNRPTARSAPAAPRRSLTELIHSGGVR